MHRICIVRKSEPHYAYKRYDYKKEKYIKWETDELLVQRILP